MSMFSVTEINRQVQDKFKILRLSFKLLIIVNVSLEKRYVLLYNINILMFLLIFIFATGLLPV